MRLIAAESDRAYNGGPLDGKYYQHSSFTPLESRLVQKGTDFLMEEYTFRLSVLYFKDLVLAFLIISLNGAILCL
jgi:hypothetical protein